MIKNYKAQIEELPPAHQYQVKKHNIDPCKQCSIGESNNLLYFIL